MNVMNSKIYTLIGLFLLTLLSVENIGDRISSHPRDQTWISWIDHSNLLLFVTDMQK